MQLVDYGHSNRNFYYNGKNNNHAVLDGRSIITVEWESGGGSVGGQPFVSSWTLDNAPLSDAASMTVTVIKKDGTETVLTRGASDGYTLSGSTISVSSSDVKTIVPEGAKLKVSYKANTALQTSFALQSADQLPANTQLVSGSERVTIIDTNGNDKSTLSSGFTFDGNTVTFNSLSNAPAEGESFQLSYKYSQQTTTQSVSETIVTDYDYTKSANTDTSKSLLCQKGLSSLSCSYTAPVGAGAGTISFSGSLSKGDRIKVTEYLQRSGSGVSINNNITLASIGLPDCEMDEAVEMRLGTRVCSSLGSTAAGKYLPVTSSGTIELLSASDCNIISDILTETVSHSSQVVFQCKEVAELPDDFLQMRKDFFELHHGKYKCEYWQVMVDGQELQLSDSSDMLIEDYKIVELKGEDTSDADAMRELFGGNDKKIKVVVRLYDAL